MKLIFPAVAGGYFLIAILVLMLSTPMIIGHYVFHYSVASPLIKTAKAR